MSARYLGKTARNEHAFELDAETRSKRIGGREIADWCIEHYGPPSIAGMRSSGEISEDGRSKRHFWYYDRVYGEKFIGLFYFRHETDAFEFRMRWG